MSGRSGFQRWRADHGSKSAAAAVRAEYGLPDDSPSPEFSYDGAGDRELSIRTVLLRGPVAGTMSERPDHVVAWMNDGSAIITESHGHSVQLAPGQPIVLSAAASYTFSIRAEKVTMVHVADELLRSVAEDLGIELDSPLVFGVQDTVMAELAPFGVVVHRYGGLIVDQDVDDVIRRRAKVAIAAAVLDVFPRVNPDGLSNHRLRDAVSFMHANAREEIDVETIADAVGMSVRGLQNLFARALDTAPIAYLRDVRLTGARDELRLSMPAETTVASVARSWGFRHLGRFAAAYRDQFDELPAETLRAPVVETPDLAESISTETDDEESMPVA